MILGKDAGTEQSPPRGWGMGLIDVMILIAATAFSIQAVRVVGHFRFEGAPNPDIKAVTFMAVWTVAAFVLRLRRPRPPWCELFRQPGAVATVTAALSVLLFAALIAFDQGAKTVLENRGVLVHSLSSGPGPGLPTSPLVKFRCTCCQRTHFSGLTWPPNRVGIVSPQRGVLFLAGAGALGALISGAWLGLVVSGRRQPERGWLDPLGRLIGTFWVVHFWFLAGTWLLLFF